MTRRRVAQPRLSLVVSRPARPSITEAFDNLTTALVLAKYRAGTLPEGVMVALLAAAGLPA